MNFPREFLDELRRRAPIVDVVGRRVQWDTRKSQPARQDFWACCPFHQEKTASFHVDGLRGYYHCFGCGAHGDALRFEQEVGGLSFVEAVKALAGDAGMEVPQPTPEARAREARRRTALDVLDEAAQYFVTLLKAPEGRAARDYLAGRGLSPETIARTRIGLAPGGWDTLCKAFRQKGTEEGLLREAGLVKDGSRGPIDVFRDRIIFPIADELGRVIAFGGRALDPDNPAKYLNSPETALFKKRETVYGLDVVRAGRRRPSRLIVVEGYMDVIALREAGVEGAVAPLGTALTEGQLKKLAALAPELTLCFDGDEAGLRAAGNAIERALPLLSPDWALSFALLPEGQDPDDCVRAGGRGAFETVLDAAVPLVEMLWRRALDGARLDTPEGRAKLEERLYGELRAIGHTALKRQYTDEISARLRSLFETSLGPRSRRPQGKDQSRRGPRNGSAPRGLPRGATLALRRSALARHSTGSPEAVGRAREEEELLVLALNHPAIVERHIERFARAVFAHPRRQRLHMALLEALADAGPLDSDALTSHLSAGGFGPDVEGLSASLAAKALAALRPEAPPGEAEACFLRLVERHEAPALKADLEEAARALGQDPSEINLKRLVELRRHITSKDTPTSASDEG